MKENVIVSHKETIEPIFSFMRTYINHFALLIKPILGLSDWCPVDSLICLSNCKVEFNQPCVGFIP